MTRTRSSSSAAPTAATRARIISSLTALRFSGWFEQEAQDVAVQFDPQPGDVLVDRGHGTQTTLD